MDKDTDRGQESIYSNRVKAGRRRTYFFDVRKTKGDDYYITLTESTRKFNGEGYNRHKIFLYKEDFNRFLEGLQDAVNHVKNDLMPDYDYEQFDRRQEEWERQAAEAKAAEASQSTETPESGDSDEAQETDGGDDSTADTGDSGVETEEDMDW